MLDEALRQLSEHFHSLAKQHPSDFRDHIKNELAGGQLELKEQMFVVRSLSAALHTHVLERPDRAEVQPCSFCGKTPREVTAMVQGTMSCICDNRVAVCVEILGERDDSQQS